MPGAERPTFKPSLPYRMTLNQALKLVIRCEAVRRDLREKGYAQMEFSFVDALTNAQRPLDAP